MSATGRPDDGMSLIEVLITIVILGLAGAALLGGIGAGITGTDVHRQQASVETVLESAGEALLDPNTPYIDCATPFPSTDYSSIATGLKFPKVSAADNSWSASDIRILGVQYWQGTFFASGNCHDHSGVVKLQRVTIQVMSPGGRVQLRRDFVKSAP